MEQVLNRKDIILVPFPFSDQSGSKQRPALVLSNDDFNKKSNDIVVCAITSNMDTDRSIRIERDDWKDGLYSECCVRYSTILTIDKKIVLKRIGRLSSERFKDVMKKVDEIFG